MGLGVWSLVGVPWGTRQLRWSREEPRVGLGGCALLRPACLGSQLRKDLMTPPHPVPGARTPCPHSISPSGVGHTQKVGAVRLARA